MAKQREVPKFSLVTSTDPLRLSLWQMKQEESHTDFQIHVEQTEIAVHKNIVAATSEYFKGMLQHPDLIEVQQGFVKFNEMKPDAVLHVVEFIYTGRIEFEFDLTKDIIQTVDRLGIIDDILMAELSCYIINNMSVQDCLSLFIFAQHHNMDDVKEKANEMRLRAFKEVCNSVDFVELDIDELTPLLRRKLQEGHAPDWNVALEAAASSRWAVHDADTRKEKFEDLLKMIPMEQCSLQVLDRVFKNHKSRLFTKHDLLEQFVTVVLAKSVPKPRDVIVFAGEIDVLTCNTRTFEINLNTGYYYDLEPMPIGRSCATICASHQGAICAGGRTRDNSKAPAKDCVSYRKNTDAWEPLTPLLDPVFGAGAVCLEDEKLFVAGGWGEMKNKANVYDFNAATWSKLDDMLQGVTWPIIGRVRKLVFVILSTHEFICVPSGSEISLQSFDTETSTWSYKAPLPDRIKTHGSQAVTIADQLYVVGGQGRICVRYSPEMNLWTILTPPQEHHMNGAATVVHNKIVICGGCTKDAFSTQSIEEYDPSADEWKMLGVKLPKPLRWHGIIPL